MDINQAFEILAKASDSHVARIITQKYGTLSRFDVWRIARKLRRGVPVAKIIHEKWFYGMPFYTDKYTLDPRPDTETLVESVLRDWDGTKKSRILDLGTGTGCIALSILFNIPGATGVGVDISRGALYVAHKNKCEMGLCNQLELVHGTFVRPNVNEQFDVIVSNPPYIARGDSRVNAAARFDPKIALYAKNDGLAAYQQIAQSARSLIKRDGRLYLEIGAGMSRAVRSIFTKNGWKFVRADKDLGGHIRVLVFSL
ncbi:MAG: peptide chain release factor N(5)-glutamine methyltransferase [Alphaproteobacteria bacterium]|nr:peptide chain release factor N(5)-glutamine methyltransferase [Alphaproteobacteria bacterium]